jgi:hypothetical protein
MSNELFRVMEGTSCLGFPVENAVEVERMVVKGCLCEVRHHAGPKTAAYFEHSRTVKEKSLKQATLTEAIELLLCYPKIPQQAKQTIQNIVAYPEDKIIVIRSSSIELGKTIPDLMIMTRWYLCLEPPVGQLIQLKYSSSKSGNVIEAVADRSFVDAVLMPHGFSIKQQVPEQKFLVAKNISSFQSCLDEFKALRPFLTPIVPRKGQSARRSLQAKGRLKFGKPKFAKTQNRRNGSQRGVIILPQPRKALTTVEKQSYIERSRFIAQTSSSLKNPYPIKHSMLYPEPNPSDQLSTVAAKAICPICGREILYAVLSEHMKRCNVTASY